MKQSICVILWMSKYFFIVLRKQTKKSSLSYLKRESLNLIAVKKWHALFSSAGYFWCA